MATAPPDLEALRDLIAGTFAGRYGAEALDPVVRRALAFGLFEEIGTGDLPMDTLARRLLIRTERDGTTHTLVGALLVARPGDAPLRDWATAHAPDQLALVPQALFEQSRPQQEMVNRAALGLATLGNLRADPAVQQRLDRSRLDLEQAASELVQVAMFKGLHDTLHQVQVQLLRPIMDSLRGFPGQAGCVDGLIEYTSQIARIVIDAQSVLDDLPANVAPPAIESGWIKDLADAGDRMRTGVNARDTVAARRAGMDLKRILRAQPPRLNTLLVQSARRIPIADLVVTMESIAARLAADDPTGTVLRNATAALTELRAEVDQRIAEHEAWQQIEASFWLSEDLIQRDDEEAFDEFSALWPSLSAQIGALCGIPCADWATDLDRSLNDFLKVCPQPIAPPVDPGARAAFSRYVSAGRLRFYLIDKELKGHCRNVAQLSVPLRDLVVGG